MSRSAPTTKFVGGVLAVMVVLTAAARVTVTRAAAQETAIFRPSLAVPEMLAPFVKHVEPGTTRSRSSATPASSSVGLASFPRRCEHAPTA